MAPLPGRGHASPVIWGNRVFLTTDIEGDVIPGVTPPKHKMDGQPFRHPGIQRYHSLRFLKRSEGFLTQ
jgi:hypothetical protein